MRLYNKYSSYRFRSRETKPGNPLPESLPPRDPRQSIICSLKVGPLLQPSPVDLPERVPYRPPTPQSHWTPSPTMETPISSVHHQQPSRFFSSSLQTYCPLRGGEILPCRDQSGTRRCSHFGTVLPFLRGSSLPSLERHRFHRRLSRPHRIRRPSRRRLHNPRT